MSILDTLCCAFIKALFKDDFAKIQNLLTQIIAEIATEPYQKYGFDNSGFKNNEEMITSISVPAQPRPVELAFQLTHIAV